MFTYLYITAGKLKGLRFQAKNGVTFGGSLNAIDLKEPQFDLARFQLLQGPKHSFFVENMEPTYPLLHNNRKTEHALLNAGDTLKVGQTEIRIKMFQQEKRKPYPKISTKPKKIINKPPIDHLIQKKFKDLQTKVVDQPISLTAFTHPMILEFVRGLQIKQSWFLGYGPRVVGSESFDLKIAEQDAPPMCFELIPTEKGVLFQTQHEQVVQLNKAPVKSQLLKDNDSIDIFETRIKVNFLR